MSTLVSSSGSSNRGIPRPSWLRDQQKAAAVAPMMCKIKTTVPSSLGQRNQDLRIMKWLRSRKEGEIET
jgi:hypothetical protein